MTNKTAYHDCEEIQPGVFMKLALADNDEHYCFIASTPDMDRMIVKAVRKKLLILPVKDWIASENGWHAYDLRKCFTQCYILDNIVLAEPLILFSLNKRLKKIVGVEKIDISNITCLDSMFRGCSIRTLKGFEKWDVSHIKVFSNMFRGCSIRDLSPVSGWDVSSAENMSGMFLHSTTVNLDALANWNVSAVKNFSFMFNECRNLVDISALSNWDISNAANLEEMFAYDSKLSDISPLADWNTSKVSNFVGMFHNCLRISNEMFGTIGKWSLNEFGECAQSYKDRYGHMKSTMEMIISGTGATSPNEYYGKPAKQFLTRTDNVEDASALFGSGFTLSVLSAYFIIQTAVIERDKQEEIMKEYKDGALSMKDLHAYAALKQQYGKEMEIVWKTYKSGVPLEDITA